ncbi:MAG: diadenylate cyclase [Candidatus Nanoarchaeia archaeon]
MTEVLTTKIEGSIGKAAASIAEEINADYVIAIGRLEDNDEENLFFEVRVSIFKRVKPNSYSKEEYVSKIKKPESGTIVSMKEILRQAIAQKMIQKGERVVCVQGEGLGSGYKGMLFVFDVDKLFFDISSNKLAEYVDSAVIEAVIDIALELSQEGREGKKVGTAFVIGKQEIMRYTKQLIINPFKNLERDERKVTDPNLRETMKEFALLDGIFMIDEDGTILSAGTYLDVDTEGLELPSGLGTRHRNCAAITAKSDALAVCVSESGGKVRVFKGGKIVMSM